MNTLENWKSVCETVSNESLADKVCNLLESSILNMELKPGTVLSEDEIAATLNVSRSPVREALLRLEHIGLVDKERKSRVVSSITEEKIINNYHIWAMVESYTAGLACLNATAQEMSAMREAIKEMEQSKDGGDIMNYHDLNYQFHEMLVAPCPYKRLIEQHKNALSHIRWGYNYTLMWLEDIGYSNSQHSDILNAYSERDRESVERAVREHTGNASSRLQSLYIKKNLNKI